MRPSGTIDMERLDVVDWMSSTAGQPALALRGLDSDPTCSSCGSPMDEDVKADGGPLCFTCVGIDAEILAA